MQRVDAAHRESARRNNVSSMAAVNCFAGSGDLNKAVASALLSLGGRHGPIDLAYKLLASSDPVGEAATMLSLGLKVPGWGNGFVRGEIDPIWIPVHQQIASSFPEVALTMDAIHATIKGAGKNIFPNPAAFTAAAAIIVGLPRRLSPLLFIQSRLPVWVELIQENCDVR